MKKYEAIIYDIDGTLLDTLKMNMIPLMKIIREETGEQWTYEEVLRFSAYPGMRVMKELKVKNPEAVYERWVSYVNAFEEGAAPYPGVREVLQACHGKLRQAVVSAKTREQYELDFVSAGFDVYMDVAVLADDTEHHKPHPEPIEKCLKLLDIEKEKVIYIGDALSDYQASVHAGVDFGYAVWGSVSAEGIRDPTITLMQPSDLLQLY